MGNTTFSYLFNYKFFKSFIFLRTSRYIFTGVYSMDGYRLFSEKAFQQFDENCQIERGLKLNDIF